MKVVISTRAEHWAALSIYTTGLLLLTSALMRGISLSGHFIRVNPSQREVLHSLSAIIWAPLAWNVFPRLEFRHRFLSRFTFGNRVAAHLLFAVYIVIFSAFRERLFFNAVSANPKWTSGDDDINNWMRRIGDVTLGFGTFLSASGFYRLRVRFTYMGEYFGFRMPKLITAFPFNFFPDPMYNGSVLMHFGYALRAQSPAGFYLATVTALSYWIAAKIFEVPFMIYCYSGQANKEAWNSAKRIEI